MAEEKKGEQNDWEIRWNGFLGTGEFDKIEQPTEGYELGDTVTGRNGIFYKVKAIGPNGNIILDAGEDKEVTLNKDDIRPNPEVVSAILKLGIVKIPPGREIKFTPPSNSPGKNSRNN